jgi:hypothetical protein
MVNRLEKLLERSGEVIPLRCRTDLRPWLLRDVGFLYMSVLRILIFQGMSALAQHGKMGVLKSCILWWIKASRCIINLYLLA